MLMKGVADLLHSIVGRVDGDGAPADGAGGFDVVGKVVEVEDFLAAIAEEAFSSVEDGGIGLVQAELV